MDTMESRRSGAPRNAAAMKWITAGLLAMVSVALFMVVSDTTPRAVAQTSDVLLRGNILVTSGQITGDTYGVFIVDMATGSIAVYQWMPATRKLRLMAVRNYTYDLQLDEYNTEPPPREVRDLVRQHRRLEETTPPGESRE